MEKEGGAAGLWAIRIFILLNDMRKTTDRNDSEILYVEDAITPMLLS